MPPKYVRKMGTSDVYAYTDHLWARGDMMPYNGSLPVPKDFVVPEAELELVAFLQGDNVPKETLNNATEGLMQSLNKPVEQETKVQETSESKLQRIAETMETLRPEEYSQVAKKPKIAVLEEKMGIKITSEERDQAFDIFKTLQESNV